MNKPRILITGASGYVGSNLILALHDHGYDITAMVRTRNIDKELPFIHYVTGDCYKGNGLDEALRDINIAYYLIHSLNSGPDFAKREAQCAYNFAQAAKRAQVDRIIYLSGLAQGFKTLSKHLASRHNVGEILAQSGIPTIEFRASAIFGAGSTSYEMISALVERLPLMILPKWVFKKTQPIFIDDALFYLTEACKMDLSLPRIIEIGGADIVSYKEMFKIYAKVRGLKRLLIPVPFLSLNLSSLWLFLVTPLHARVGKNLISSLMNETYVKDQSYLSVFKHKPLGIMDMIKQALASETQEILNHEVQHQTRFDKAKRMFGFRFGRYLIKRDSIHIDTKNEIVFSVIENIGGINGWYYMTSMWRLRGFIDRICGGPGFSLGKSELPLTKGSIVDCWSVYEIIPGRRLVFQSKMKMPGDAFLEFEIIPHKNSSLLYQTAFFRPKGFLGSLYWHLLYPMHELIFKGMLRAIKRRSLKASSHKDT